MEMNRRRRVRKLAEQGLALTAAVSVALVAEVRAADKSGVSPQSISLPSGPGSIEGLGESFEPQLNSGTFTYRIPLKLPPIRGGAPALAVNYSSGNGNGMLGQGWALRLPNVRRQTDKGLPLYTNTDLFYDENAEELVHLADGSYRQKIESLFIRYQQTISGWIGKMPSGTSLLFGSTNQSRLDWMGHGTFCWMLDSSEDPNGNRCEYYYLQDQQQIYPQEIRYGLHATQPSSFFSVQFRYSTNRPDPFVDCRSRFASTNRLRLQTISVFFGTRRIRQWQFDYDTNAPVSLLTSITEFGDDRSATNNTAQVNVDYLPPTLFAYTPYVVATQAVVRTIVFSGAEPNFAFGGEDGGSSGNYAEFVDINHDGLPDILVNSGNQWRSLVNPGPFTNSWPLSQLITNPPPVSGVTLGQSSTRLLDLRGDGRSKLLVTQNGSDPDGSTAFYYYDFISPSTLGPAQSYATLNSIRLGDSEVQFADLDDDKAMDLLRINIGGGFLENLYTRSLSGGTNQYLTTPNPFGFDFSQGWRLADLNGDRLQDFVYLNPSSGEVDVSLNLGWGQFAQPYALAGGPTGTDLQSGFVQLVDLNQDGLADLVVVENGAVRIWLNQNGTSWAEPITISGTPQYQQNQDIVRFADIDGSGSVDIIWHHGQDPAIQYVDLFPSGKAYLLNHSVTTQGRSLDVAYKSSTDYMSQDAATTNRWTIVAPFPVPVVSEIVEGDGLGNFYSSQFTYRNAYYDGLEREFRGFEQASKTELGDDSQGAPTLVTVFQFDTGSTNESLKGKPLRLQTQTTSGTVFYRQTNFWFPRPLALQTAPTETRSVTFAFQTRKLTQEVEMGDESNAVTLEEKFNYDDFGNQILAADYGRVESGNRAAWGDERIIARQFSAEFPSGTNLWLLDRLIKEERQDFNGAVFARKQIYYDDPTFGGNNFGVVSLGNPTLIQDWIDISNNISRQTLRQEFDTFGNVVATFDPLGVPSQPAVGHFRQVQFDSQIHTHPIIETIYTGNPDAIANGISQPSLSMQANYDFGLGVLTSATDFNQNTSLFSFDTFGRLITITKPYDTTNFPTAVFSYTLRQPVSTGQTINFTSTSFRQTVGQTNTFDSRSFFDGLGRKVMTRTKSETNGVVVVSDGTVFNQRRSIWRSFLPYFDAGTLDFTAINQAVPYVETDHDALDRETEISQPPTAPDNHRAFSRTTYAPLVRLLQDEEQTRTNNPHFGAAKRYTEDGLRSNNGKGRLRSVEEIVKLTGDGYSTGSTNLWLTQYRYDILDNFLGYTDSQNNQKTFRYDALSRKVFMNDPDRGIMQWNYDLASNVTNTFDAKGQQILYNYDGVNRLLTEKYLDGKPQPVWRVASVIPQLSTNYSVIYHYDLPLTNVAAGDNTLVTSSNTLGKLTWVEDLSGEEHTGYDARGRVSYVIKRIPDPLFLSISNPPPQNLLVSYRTSFGYDSLDRAIGLTYPDNDAIGYNYNDRDLLQSIQGGVNGLTRSGAVIENITYQPSAQLGSIVYGNGVVTTYGYDPRLRLTSILTVSTALTNEQLINFGYDFDDASNIKTIHDNRPISTVAAGDPRRNTQLFAYDDLYRITSAGYCFGPPGATNIDGGSITYRYDRIGNMLAQVSTFTDTDPITGLPSVNLGSVNSGGNSGRSNRNGRSSSDPPGPHALTSINPPSANNYPPRIYPYDGNGNMLNIDGLTNTWDFKDRLVSVENSQMRAQYTYDYTDRRIIKDVIYKPGSSNFTNNDPHITTLYIDKFFEVRDYEQPTKYVWNGSTRIGSAIGSFSNRQRVQRLRLWPGMNLVSVGVNGASLPTNTSLVTASYQWNDNDLSWSALSSGATVSVNTPIWIQAATNGTLICRGSYTDPTGEVALPGPNFLPVKGLESFPLTDVSVNVLTNHWHYNAKNKIWSHRLEPNLAEPSGLPAALAPGEVLFAHVDSAVQIAPVAAARLSYYHDDYLGSLGCASDTYGSLVKQMCFYPFGKVRQLVQNGLASVAYTFTQKEQDSGTAFYYFDSRFYSSDLSRFSRIDPLAASGKGEFLTSPQSLNFYAYCANRPVVLTDPTGMFSLEAHETIMVEAATAAGIRDPTRRQILMQAAVWQDVNKSTLYESHFGSKQYWHSMAPHGEHNPQNLVNAIMRQASAWYRGSDSDLAKLGHMIADSFSQSHVARDSSGRIIRFQSYGSQDSAKHERADDPLGKIGSTEYRSLPGYNDAVNATTKLLQMHEAGAGWGEVEKWLREDVYRLAPNVQAGGTEKAYAPDTSAVPNPHRLGGKTLD